MARLSLSFLGPIEVTQGGKPANGFESNRVRALLAYLAMDAERTHRRQALAGLLWPDRLDHVALSNLRQALSNLRSTIGDRSSQPPFLLISHDTIQFNPDSDFWLDARAFGNLVAACASHRHRRRDDCDECAARLERACELYRGDFLDHFFLVDSSAFDEWSTFKREWLRRLALEALYHLVTYHERRGDLEQARRYAWRQVEIEPWREEAHRQLMRLYLRLGQRSAALAQYASLVRVLAEEMGVEPSDETRTLYDRIAVTGASLSSASLPAQLPPLPLVSH